MINVLEHHGMLEVGLSSLQVVHASIGETGAHFQSCTFWLWHRCFLRVSPLWHRCFPLDFTGALFFVPSRDSAFSAILFELCLYLWPIACFCKSLMLNISFGCCRHSVSNTFVQLTEGRSARDQPKQPPAKKSISKAARQYVRANCSGNQAK